MKKKGRRFTDDTPKVDNTLRVRCEDCHQAWFTPRPTVHPPSYPLTCPSCGGRTIKARKVTEGEIIRLAKGGLNDVEPEKDARK